MPKKNERLYPLSYKLQTNDPPITMERAKELGEDGFGSCDAMLMASILFPEDGSYSCLFLSEDGRTGENLSDMEWFKVWTMLTKRLLDSEELGEGRKMILTLSWEMIMKVIFGRDVETGHTDGSES